MARRRHPQVKMPVATLIREDGVKVNVIPQNGEKREDAIARVRKTGKFKE